MKTTSFLSRPASAIIVALTLFLIASCSRQSREVLQINSTLPSGVVAGDQVLTFRLSRAVVPQESTNVWMNTQFIEFTPSIPGKFVWQDTLTLIFSPDGPYPGDTKFDAKINTALLVGLSGAKSFGGETEFSFSTERFRLSSAEFFYDRLGERRRIGIRANLEFTYTVNPADVGKFIRVTVDGQTQEGVVVMSTEPARVIPIELGVATQTDREKEINVDFSSDFVSPATQTHITMEKPFVFVLPRIDELKIYGHDFSYDGKEGSITIRTSQEVDSAAAAAFLTIEPQREYAITGDRQSFTLKGKFEPGTSFHLLIKKGLLSILEGKLGYDYEADIIMGDIKPSFGFANQTGIYMLLTGQKKIELKTINLPKLLVRVSQVFQNNLVFFLDEGRWYDYWYDEEGGDDPSYSRKYRYAMRNYGRLLFSDSVDIGGQKNRELTTPFDLGRFITTDYRGFFLVEISNPAEPWRSTSMLVSISDLGLIVKQSRDEVVVFAVSLDANTPVRDAEINLISTTNQIFASAKSDADGMVRFGSFTEKRKDFILKLITAQKGDDYNFIHLQDNRIETSRFDVGGKRDAQNVYDAMLYGDRNMYRPGEKMIVTGIVRNLTNPVPSGMPVRVKIINPRGTTVKEFQQNLNSDGSFEIAYQTSSTSLTGSYSVELQTGNKMYLTGTSVSVEDFVPDRLRVSLSASKEKAVPGETISYSFEALNFFGPPAAGRNYEFEGSYTVVPYTSKRFREFRFSDDRAAENTASPYVQTGKTDASGKGSVSMPVPATLSSPGLLRARGRVAVFDESGRPVYQLAQTTIFPKGYYIGVRNRGDYYISPNTPQSIQVIAVNRDDTPVEGFKAKIDLVRFEWYSVLRQYGDSKTLRYVSERREIVEKSAVVTLGSSPAEYTYVVPRSGSYEIRVSKDGEAGYNSFSFYSYSWGTSDITSFKVDPEARVQIVFNDSVYRPGDRAKVLFQTPFDGKMLVTVERNQVFSHTFVDVVNNSASIEIPVEEKFLPNVYVSAVLFRKIKEMNIPLLAGHGFAPMFVEKKSNKLDVTISAPEKIRPKTTQSITVKAGNEENVCVTLAAVDEGILQIKNYKTPDPYGYFYMKKALETETFDFFRFLISEPEKSTTGGSDEAIGKRVNPLGVMRFKPLALWSGIVKTGGNGEVNIPFTIPEFNGELRLMAVAYKGDRFGSAQSAMKVADPIVLTPALPRFASPGDSILMPITAFNTTDKPASLTLIIETSGGISAVSRTATLEVGPNQERFVVVPLKVGNQIGKAVVTVKTSAFGESMESTTELPVRPVAPYATDVVTGAIEGGKSVAHEISGEYLAGNRSSYVTLSPFPVANFAKELKQLVGYPHGCIEQTVSKAFPQIYLRDIAQILDPAILNSGSPTYFVNEAIAKITTMQLPDGKFAYWPGGTEAYPWASVYATHFLIEARKAGYAVPDAVLNPAMSAIAGHAREKLMYDHSSYGPDGKVTVRRMADKSCLYALYVLALGGKADKAVMNYYRSDKSILTNDTRYLLGAAFALAGDRAASVEILPQQFATEESRRETGHTFDSPIRSNALILSLLIDLNPDDPNIPRYMEYLSKAYRSGGWYSTQDNAFTLLAFGKAARIARATKVSGTITAGSKSFTYNGGTEKFDINPFGGKVSISLNGEGRVYYSIVTSGIRVDGKVPIQDKNLQVRREFFDRTGNRLDLSNVKQNDLLVVKLTLTPGIDRLENIAISDLLPGGFEIENARISDNTAYGFVKNAAAPEYVDIRDDRINYYISAFSRNPLTFYYLVRAVSAGTFIYAPVQAEAMYNGDYNSASGGGKVRVVR